ncbi:MAG: hypothetical protein KDJ97_35565 [Anaerolineae bacterium]|nr:hypothetical protein [Anaerolineae bacterium]
MQRRHRLVVEQVLLKDQLQGGLVNLLVFDPVRVDNHHRPVAAHRQAVGDLAGGMMRVFGIVQAVLLD